MLVLAEVVSGVDRVVLPLSIGRLLRAKDEQAGGGFCSEEEPSKLLIAKSASIIVELRGGRAGYIRSGRRGGLLLVGFGEMLVGYGNGTGLSLAEWRF